MRLWWDAVLSSFHFISSGIRTGWTKLSLYCPFDLIWIHSVHSFLDRRAKLVLSYEVITVIKGIKRALPSSSVVLLLPNNKTKSDGNVTRWLQWLTFWGEITQTNEFCWIPPTTTTSTLLWVWELLSPAGSIIVSSEFQLSDQFFSSSVLVLSMHYICWSPGKQFSLSLLPFSAEIGFFLGNKSTF